MINVTLTLLISGISVRHRLGSCWLPTKPPVKILDYTRIYYVGTMYLMYIGNTRGP